jgi:hypothetical protein
MRLGAWLASTKLTLLPRSSTASRTTDGEGLFLPEFLFHGAKERIPQKPFIRLVNFGRSILNSVAMVTNSSNLWSLRVAPTREAGLVDNVWTIAEHKAPLPGFALTPERTSVRRFLDRLNVCVRDGGGERKYRTALKWA